MLYKTCTQCRQKEPLDAFYRDARKKDGRQSKCKTCSEKATAAWRAANPERVKAHWIHAAARGGEARKARACATSAAWRAQNPERHRTNCRKSYEANREERMAARKAWNEAHPGHAYRKTKEWREANPERTRLLRAIDGAERRAAKLLAAPEWADREKVREVYARAKEMAALGIDVHVDHYYPLRGKTVSGLHVHNNLRVILADENIRKANKHPDHV